MKVTEQDNGAYTSFGRVMPSGYYVAKLYAPSGELFDKIVCDDYRRACEYLRAFNKAAKNLW